MMVEKVLLIVRTHTSFLKKASNVKKFVKSKRIKTILFGKSITFLPFYTV